MTMPIKRLEEKKIDCRIFFDRDGKNQWGISKTGEIILVKTPGDLTDKQFDFLGRHVKPESLKPNLYPVVLNETGEKPEHKPIYKLMPPEHEITY